MLESVWDNITWDSLGNLDRKYNFNYFFKVIDKIFFGGEKVFINFDAIFGSEDIELTDKIVLKKSTSVPTNRDNSKKFVFEVKCL